MARVEDHEITLRSMSQAELDAWLPVAMREYEESRMDAGDSPEQADAARATSESQFFPGGRLVDGHLLFTMRAMPRRWNSSYTRRSHTHQSSAAES
ncbi:hypothetical protein ACC691_36125, partial [Rhizobium johnstonii]|uniref:hypothetical protein n=1 Tax=Rhizobium johnstonii TaxID=3019933 RepID=UPI003F9C7300